MAKIYDSIYLCLRKPTQGESQQVGQGDLPISRLGADTVTIKGNAEEANDKQPTQASELKSGDQARSSGVLQRVSGGVYNLGSGAVSVGVGSVKWATSTTLSIGSSVIQQIRRKKSDDKDKKD